MAMLCKYGGECEGCNRCTGDDVYVCDWCQDEITDYYYEINGAAICSACAEGRIVYIV